MEYDEVLAQILALLQQERRLSYRVLKRRFQLDDDFLEDLKEDLIYARQLAVDEDGRVLVWRGDAGVTPPSNTLVPQTTHHPAPQEGATAHVDAPPDASGLREAEHRQLTVLFCDLVDSTRLARQLDPEDWRNVVRAYQQACAAVIQRFEGYIAQYLGDGLLVYFGYPQAHEDDAQRAGHAGLGLLEAMEPLNTQLAQERGMRLAVRVGIHTGPVVVGAMGGGGRQEQLALGDTPNLAARLQGLAAPNTVVVSAATLGLIEGFFTCQALGEHPLKGVDEPLPVYQLLAASGAQTRLDAVAPRGWTPLVGREQEVGLLRERWTQSAEGRGQVVLLSGEAGIGKSRLVEVLREQVGREKAMWLTFRCSAYHTNSALYPVITHLHRTLQWHTDDTPLERLDKLEHALQATRLPLEEAVPLMAALLSVPLAERYPPLDWSPQQQRQKTHETLVAWLVAEAERQPVLAVWEDLHWADPSTLELLGLLLEQTPTAPLCALLTCRPEFPPPWAPRSYLTQLTLSRLTRLQVEEMVLRITGGKALPAEVVRQIVARTDGVPLFVEELTKMVLESGLLREGEDRYDLTGPLPPLAIPATLQDALRARLDRLTDGKAVAQLGAVLGRTFAYELLRAVAPLDELVLWRGLVQLVQAEVLYQRGVLPHATYTFKHALLQEAAYQSLLRRTRQQYHQRIAQVLAVQFPEITATQPELLAHHYTEAGLAERALGYWQRAGQHANARFAHVEAVSHLTKGLALLATLPKTPARSQQELDLQMPLGVALTATKGSPAHEVEQTYARARVLCAQVGETPQLFAALRGLCRFYYQRGELRTARDLGEQLLRLAQRAAVPTHLLEAHSALGLTLWRLGDYAAAQTHCTQGMALTDLTQQRVQTASHALADGVGCLLTAANTLWCLGFPAQAVQRSQESLALAQALEHPLSLASAQSHAAVLHYRRRDVPAVQAQADALLTLATAQGFPLLGGDGIFWRGYALAMQGQGEAGLAQMRQGLAAMVATGHDLGRAGNLLIIAAVAESMGHVAEGLRLLAQALPLWEASERRDSLTEAYRLQGALLLQQAIPDAARAEACFQQALALARRQQAKSWELRAAMSLARLWQHQGKRDEACNLLAPIYGWFTEGFDTADLQDAKALLGELS
jgi:class 3 adenylate cyclase/predicted ATPase